MSYFAFNGLAAQNFLAGAARALGVALIRGLARERRIRSAISG